MRTPPLLLLVGSLILAGCTAAPVPTPSPTPTRVYFTGAPLVSPEPTPTPPGLGLPTPGPATITSTINGRPMRVIPADPGATFECRRLTAAEVATIKDLGTPLSKDKPSAAVDVAEGWSILAFYQDLGTSVVDGTQIRQDNAILTRGGQSSTFVQVDTWPGTHSLAGVALTDGSRALIAARQCITEG